MYYPRLRDLREDNDLKQCQVAEFLKTTQQVYSRYEKGTNEIPVRHIISLAKFYNVDINDLDYKEKYHIIDDNCETDATWIDMDNFLNGELKIYPKEIFKYLK